MTQTYDVSNDVSNDTLNDVLNDALNNSTPKFDTSFTIDYDLLAQLAIKPHPLLHIEDDFENQIRSLPAEWVLEVFQQARTAHHLLDSVGIPSRPVHSYDSDLDSRVYRAIHLIQELTKRLAKAQKLQSLLNRVQERHTPTYSSFNVISGLCSECDTQWPCDTYRIISDTHHNTDK